MASAVLHAPQTFQLYKRRYIMLFLFVVSSIVNFMQWIEYSIIADAIVEFYGVSYEAVNWTAMMCCLIFVPLIFLAVYLMNRMGTRKSLLLACFGTCLGSWIKVGSASPNRFWVYMLGQGVIAIVQPIFCSLPVPVAAAWFGENEVSTACGIGVFGLQIGAALGFLLPPMIVHTSSSPEVLQYELYVLTIGAALLCTLFFIISFLAFQDEPPTPPSLARMKSKDLGKIEFLPSLVRLLKNRSYIILVLSYGFNVGVFYGLGTLLNQIVLFYYPDAAEDAGRIGLIIVVAGMPGALIFGLILDKFHRFKATTFVVYIGCFLSILTFSFTLPLGLPLLYIVAVIIGFFTTGIIPVGYEVAIELTYPEPECMSNGLVQIIAQIVGIGFTYLYSYMFYSFGDLIANLTTSGWLLFSSILVLFIRFDLKRRKAQTEGEIRYPEIGTISKEIAY